MTDTISKDLFLAILAMDVYNRGYDANLANGKTGDLDGLGERVGSTRIGPASILSNLETARMVDESQASVGWVCMPTVPPSA